MTGTKLQALIFDVDGTLADNERDGHRVAFNQAFDDAGLDWHWDVALYGKLLAVAGGKERIQYFLAEYHPGRLAEPGVEAMIAELHEAKTAHYIALVSSGKLPLRPGVTRLINEARQAGLRIAIATTTSPENVTALLEHSLAPGASEWFECIGAGDVVPAKKPAPDIYHWVLERMQLAPAEALAIEDSENGLRSAQGAGLATVVTVNDYTAAQAFDGAIQQLADLGETCLADLQAWHRAAIA